MQGSFIFKNRENRQPSFWGEGLSGFHPYNQAPAHAMHVDKSDSYLLKVGSIPKNLQLSKPVTAMP